MHSETRVAPVSLAEIVELTDAGPGRYVAAGADRSSGPRVYGGQLVAQALAAAGRTAPDGRVPHSLHGHFLHPGDPDAPIEYDVDALRDGRAQTVRQVLGKQGPHDVFALTVSFAPAAASGPVLEHQEATSPVPDFDAVESVEETLARADAGLGEWFTRRIAPKPVEVRFVERPARDYVLRGEAPPSRQQVLMRIREPLPDNPLAHACGLAYFSDMFLLSTAVYPHRAVIGDRNLLVASLDHAIWFHGPVRADEWLLYDMESDWAGQGRGLCRGRMFDATGRLIATIVQEGLVKPLSPRD
ncbi:acyl-CoA thioesterase [Cryptosporangium aurantiacum]|uniref:Acyl-CoA thioesterase-2 n=1 Tax=Cryptosporangium aurantiacum TaxID=134849 RepID=A0A1M7RBA7_9ACTN|nr:acyl-CoA thioesterase domain-containing protein [Cryptosporangium aurantiacum]SHN43419.1 acyl-CoA thioesterase-2 [Cryptosporangium aurantiacum]